MWLSYIFFKFYVLFVFMYFPYTVLSIELLFYLKLILWGILKLMTSFFKTTFWGSFYTHPLLQDFSPLEKPFSIKTPRHFLFITGHQSLSQRTPLPETSSLMAFIRHLLFSRDPVYRIPFSFHRDLIFRRHFYDVHQSSSIF